MGTTDTELLDAAKKIVQNPLAENFNSDCCF